MVCHNGVSYTPQVLGPDDILLSSIRWRGHRAHLASFTLVVMVIIHTRMGPVIHIHQALGPDDINRTLTGHKPNTRGVFCKC